MRQPQLWGVWVHVWVHVWVRNTQYKVVSTEDRFFKLFHTPSDRN